MLGIGPRHPKAGRFCLSALEMKEPLNRGSGQKEMDPVQTLVGVHP